MVQGSFRKIENGFCSCNHSFREFYCVCMEIYFALFFEILRIKALQSFRAFGAALGMGLPVE